MRLPFLLLLFCPAALAQSTGAIGGRVIDDIGDPLPGANVVLQGTQLGAATDIDGNFVITEIPPGEYEVAASFVGYAVHTEAVRVSAEQTHWLVFELDSMVFDCYVETVSEAECDDPNIWRPYISRDPFASRVFSGEQIACLPINR